MPLRMWLRISFLAYVLLATQEACAQDVRIGVLGLFRPHEITVKTAPGQALIIQTKTVQGGEKSFTLERSSGRGTAEITASGDGLIVQSGNQSLRISELRASSRGNASASQRASAFSMKSRRGRDTGK